MCHAMYYTLALPESAHAPYMLTRVHVYYVNRRVMLNTRSAREQVEYTSCVENMRQLGLGLRLFLCPAENLAHW